MKSKVGLVSVYNHNYGSILQAFAFQQVLNQKGIDNEIIYYEKNNGLKQFLRIFNGPLLKAKIKNIWRNVYCKLDKKAGKVMNKREHKFIEFIDKRFVFSQKYIGREELVEGSKKYRAFILGSDQVWNPMNLGSDYYTLSFCPHDALKVTYASSFGVSEIPEFQVKRTCKYLNSIDEIAVREKSGAEIIYNLINRDVQVVVDPTLLFDAEGWDEFIPDDNIVKEPYIFAYFVGANKEHRTAVINLAEKTGLKVIGIPYVDELVKADNCLIDDNYLDVGPAEFVNLVRHAEYVCTDSFHATVFSILNKRNFFVFDRYKNNSKNSMNTRLSSILMKLGLEDRFVNRKGDIISWYDEIIDYSSVTEKLNDFRRDSYKYLDKICDMIKNEVTIKEQYDDNIN